MSSPTTGPAGASPAPAGSGGGALPRSSIVCGGCGTVVDPAEPYPFRCPRAGDGGDHVLRRILDAGTVRFPAGGGERNPFVRYRTLLHAYHLAVANGMADAAFVHLVRELDAAVAAVDGHGFTATPLREEPALAKAVGLAGGQLLVKDETRNVSGSHKARHLFGLLIHLEVVARLGLGAGSGSGPGELVIASCGNAALAAAVVAAAGGRALRVFVPTDADPWVLARLRDLGAAVDACERVPGEAGDPTYLRMQEAIGAGALPFTCQGNENGLAVEGGTTMAYELVTDLADAERDLDDVVIQVGGGALASALAEGLADAVALGALARMPRVHTVQTESAWPLARAHRRLEAIVPAGAGAGTVEAVLRVAAARRSDFMWPWETAPHSIAHGILDDETYDWLAVEEAMLTTGGHAAVVGEDELESANRMAVAETGVDVDETGSSGLAGLVRLVADGVIEPGATAAVLFTGVRRPTA